MSEIVTKLLMNATAIQLLKGIGQRGKNRLNKCSLILKEKKKKEILSFSRNLPLSLFYFYCGSDVEVFFLI